MLYSSFSARKAISEQQLTQLQSFVKALKTLRSQSLYGQAQPVASFIQGSAEKSDGPGKELARLKDDPTLADSLLIEDMDGSVTHDSLHSPSSPLAKPATSVALLPRLAPLPAALASLSTQLGATQTTRTSLLSTLSSYTSHLHSQIFLLSRSSGGNAASYYGGVGLKSLGENLEKEGGLGAAEKRDESKETREDIRKEIRAIKGMLLSRCGLSARAVGAVIRRLIHVMAIQEKLLAPGSWHSGGRNAVTEEEEDCQPRQRTRATLLPLSLCLARLGRDRIRQGRSNA